MSYTSRRPSLVRAVSGLFRPKNVINQGDYVTFKPEGFVAAEDPSALFCRHYYEVARLRRAFRYVSEFGISRGRSLEIGCGYGRLSPHIAEYFDRHDAVDINQWGVSRGRQCYPKVSFGLGSATDLAFDDHAFDAVVTWTVLQHIPNHLIAAALKEIARVAKSKSLIVLCEATAFADRPQPDSAHTHDRSSGFYANALVGRPLIVSEYISELDAIPNLHSPGELMVFGPLG